MPAFVTSVDLSCAGLDLTTFDILAPSRVVSHMKQRNANHGVTQGDSGTSPSGDVGARNWFREYLSTFFFYVSHPGRTVAEVIYSDNSCSRMREYHLHLEVNFKSLLSKVEQVAAQYILFGTSYKSLFQLWEGEVAARNIVYAVKVVPNSRDVIIDDPDRPGRKVLNSFTCFPFQYDPGFVVDDAQIVPFLEHLREVWCCNELAADKYLRRWIAHVLQKPERKDAVGTALLMRGAPGTGKNIPFELIRKYLLLPHSVGYSQGVEKITQRFNSFLDGKLLLILDEVSAMRQDGTYDDKVVDSLKAIITQLVAGVEKKFHETQQALIPCRLAVLTNHPAPIPVPPEDRRWFCLELAPLLLEDEARRDRLVQCCITEGQKTALHLYHYFMRLDLGNFEREAPPRTRWRANLEHAFQEPCAKWMQEMVEDASIIETLSDGALRDMWNSFRTRNYGQSLKITWFTVKARLASYCGVLSEFRSLVMSSAAKDAYRQCMRRERVWYERYGPPDATPGPSEDEGPPDSLGHGESRRPPESSGDDHDAPSDSPPPVPPPPDSPMEALVESSFSMPSARAESPEEIAAGDSRGFPKRPRTWGTVGDWSSTDPGQLELWLAWYRGPRSTRGGAKGPIVGCTVAARDCAEDRPCEACTSKYKIHK